VIKKSKGCKNVCVGAGAGVLIRISGSVEPEPEEIYTAPQQWLLLRKYIVEGYGTALTLTRTFLHLHRWYCLSHESGPASTYR
jgi:hypothetical protein